MRPYGVDASVVLNFTGIKGMYDVIDCDAFEYDDGSAAFTINNNFKLAGIRLWKTGKPVATAKKENIPVHRHHRY